MLYFKTEPWIHQRKALEYFMSRAAQGLTYGALFTDMGTGKTKIMIDFINNMPFKIILVVCPKKAANVWIRQFKIHSYNEICVHNVVDWSGNKKVKKLQHLKTIPEEPVVIVCNYESVWREPFRSFLLNKLKIDCVICDESHRIKSPGAKCSSFLTLIGRRVKYRYMLTGTPLGQSPLDIYAQYRYLAPEIFGTNYSNFKNRYANMINMGDYEMLDKKNPYRNLDELKELMFSCAFMMKSNVTLPKIHTVRVEYQVSSKLEKVYRELAREGAMEIEGGTIETKNILSMITRFQQILGGYIPVEYEEDGLPVTRILPVDTSRIETYEELIEGLPLHEPIVVFCRHRKDIENVISASEKTGRACSEVSGKCDESEQWIDGNTDIVVVQIQAGAESLDFTRARYCIYYTLHPSLILWKQSRKRLHRPGQTRPVVYYVLQAKMRKGKAIDEKMYIALRHNKEVIDSIMEDGWM